MAEDWGQCVRCVRICQHNACRKAGSKQVLAAFKAQRIARIEVQASGCFGQCGHGPMVLVLPEQVWYDRVSVEDVEPIVTHHLHQGQPVQSLLYRRFHQP